MKPSFDQIRDLREQWEATLSATEYRQRMTAQVETMEVGDPGRAELLACLASDRSEEVSERSLELARAAFDDGGPTTIDARGEVVRALYLLGRDDEASLLVRHLLRTRSRDDVTVGLHATLGEVLEIIDRPKDAQRAYTVGLKYFDPELDDPDLDESLCLAGRYRVRRGLAVGRDEFDRCMEEISPDAAAAIRERVAGTLT